MKFWLAWALFVVNFWVVDFASPVMDILVHTGLNLAGLQLVPRILPNTCDLARLVEGKEDVYPCERDEFLKWWRTGEIEEGRLRVNTLYVMCCRVILIGGFWFFIVWFQRSVDEREERKRMMEEAEERAVEEGDVVEGSIAGKEKKCGEDLEDFRETTVA